MFMNVLQCRKMCVSDWEILSHLANTQSHLHSDKFYIIFLLFIMIYTCIYTCIYVYR